MQQDVERQIKVENVTLCSIDYEQGIEGNQVISPLDETKKCTDKKYKLEVE